MDLIKIQMKVRNKYLKYRSINRLVIQPYFKEAWKIGNKELAIEFIEKGEKDKLDQWVKNTLKDNSFEAWNMKDLRLLGSKLGVKNYNYLLKLELLSSIKNKMELKNERLRRNNIKDKDKRTK